MDQGNVDIKIRITWLLVCYALFLSLYKLSSWMAVSCGESETLMLQWEEQIPFVPMMIIPYMSSGLFFVALFFICRHRDEFYLMTKRLIVVTIVATMLHIVFPYTNAFIKPQEEAPLLKEMFGFLAAYDTSFNQFPSLHVCYALIYWSVVQHSIGIRTVRIGLKIWIVAIILSTLLVYQHHFVDIIGAFLLTSGTNIFLNRNKGERIGNTYYFCAWALIYAIYYYPLLFFFGWVACALLVVGRAYCRNMPRFAKQPEGTLKPATVLLLAPYVLFYALMRFVLRIRKRPLVQEPYPGIYAGALLTSAQSKRLFKDGRIVIYDLSAELPENPFLRRHTYNYKSRPVLDLLSPDHLADEIAEAFKKNKLPVFIHCTMGNARSITVANLVVNKLQ